MRRRLLSVPALLLLVGCGEAPSLAGLFPAGAVWTTDVSSAPVDASSEKVMQGVVDAGGWGHGYMQVDATLNVLVADATTAAVPFTPSGDWYSPDCDDAPVPLPEGGAVEDEPGYACTDDGDCHLLVIDPSQSKLYEMWRADVEGDHFSGGCLAVWDTSRVYDDTGRGAQCTSADAAGLPITPLLFTADEVAAGSIDHAIRFILPNDRIRAGVYVEPATHATTAARGSSATPPYGAHLRLRADYPLDTLPSAGARVVARAMQKYGMFLADSGNVALTAASDRGTTAKWSDVLDMRALSAIDPTDFDLLDAGDPTPYTAQCVRNPP